MPNYNPVEKRKNDGYYFQRPKPMNWNGGLGNNVI